MAIQRVGRKWHQRIEDEHPEIMVSSVWHRGGSGHTAFRVYGRQDGRNYIWWYMRQTGELVPWADKCSQTEEWPYWKDMEWAK